MARERQLCQQFFLAFVTDVTTLEQEVKGFEITDCCICNLHPGTGIEVFPTRYQNVILFIDPDVDENESYGLLSSSPCIGYAEITAGYGIVDFNDVSRDATPDIGAIEYVGP